jgi:3-hydroxy acid dehydrogenase/malonic semialdehyde reductase
MSSRLEGSTLVTGGAGGIGRAIVQALAVRGERVIIGDFDAAAAKILADSLGPKVLPLALDVTDAAAVDSLLDRIPAGFLPLHTLVNNAGHDVGGRTRFDQGSADDWASIIDTNLKGMMRVTRSVIPAMVKRDAGDIVNITSVSAVRMVPDMAAYTASKAGAKAFTEMLRADLAETGLRITEIQPGLTRTDIIVKRYRGDREAERAYFEQYRMALDPADVARSVLFALDQPPQMQIAEILLLPVNRW